MLKKKYTYMDGHFTPFYHHTQWIPPSFSSSCKVQVNEKKNVTTPYKVITTWQPTCVVTHKGEWQQHRHNEKNVQ